MVGGYVNVDFKGFNIDNGASPADTISGIYNKCREAIKTKKPVFFKNIKKAGPVSGTTVEISPLCAALTLGESNVVLASLPAFGTNYAVHFTITSLDYVYVSVIGPEESEDAGE